jgi:hypothetical protein
MDCFSDPIYHPIDFRKKSETDRQRVHLDAEPLLKKAQEFYLREGLSTKVGWDDPSSRYRSATFSLIGKARMTTFLSLTPSNWIEPS